MNDLNTEILEAHAREDKPALVALYGQAARDANDVDAACFFATYAYIYALELGHPDQKSLKAFLVSHGRETDEAE